MGFIYTIHSMFGERLLPVLIVIAAIYLTVTWKPDGGRNVVARIMPVLIYIQVTLGLLWFVILLVQGDGMRLLSFPFILHPILGIVTAGIGHMAAGGKGPFARFGRWSPLIGLAIVLVLVLIVVVIGRTQT